MKSFHYFSKVLTTDFVCVSNNFKPNFIRKMSDNKSPLLERAKTVVPHLDIDRHKGQAGRIGVFGGSLEYTGAPYFSGLFEFK